MRNEDTLNGNHEQSAHHRPEHETASGRMTVHHAHFPTAHGQVPNAAPFLVEASAQRVIPGPDGVVTLPAGVELSDVHVVGRDLVVSLPDGTQMIIADGAVFVPELVIGTVEVPATNLAALLIDAEPKPAAGQSSSSGGNFAVPVPLLDPAAPLGDLLPPTDLGYTPPTFKELGQIIDNKPSVIIDTPNQPTGAENATATVDESALPAGRNPSSTAETTTGSIVVTSLDNPTAVTINGVTVTGPGQVISGTYGAITIVSIVDGIINYSYTLSGPTSGDATKDVFAVVVTDRDGDTANATLTVSIVDDVPTARNDTDALLAGAYGPESGNVITGTGTTSGSAGADTKGADGASVSAITAGTASDSSFDEAGNLVIHGLYGTLTMKADGSYSYVRDPGSEGGVSDSFGYTLKDGDGDTSNATLTINIADATPTISINPGGEGGTTVSESGLPARGSESAGSDAAANSETTSGTIAFTPGDGPAAVAINGTSITTAGQTITNATGTLTITSIGAGGIGYTYTLIDNTSGDNTLQTFTVTITDKDGDVATGDLVIHIADDHPTARPDSIAEAQENAPVTIAVTANDTFGADGVDVATKVVFVAGSLSGSGTLVNNHDGSFTYTPGKGEEGDVTFNYTITDGDGDSSTATVTIHLQPDSTPTVIVTQGSDTSVNESGLPGGSDAASPSETATGTIGITTGNDTIGKVVIGGIDVTNGGTVHGAYGDLIVTGTPATGYTYSYTLSGPTTGDVTQENFPITVTDSDGDPASTSLVIHIVDDVPTARDDSASQSSEGAPVSVTVFANDTPGADGVSLTTGVSVVPGTLSGTGMLAYNGDGSFTYTPGKGEEADVTFKYTITDKDGDPSTASVTLHLKPDSTPTMIVAAGSDTSVDEAALSFGSTPGSTAETATGTFTITTGGDTLASLVLQGKDGPVNVTAATNASPVVVHGLFGDLTVTSDGAGHYSYSYTLLVATNGDATHDDFTYVATDSDGDATVPATLVISIVDDVPHAVLDSGLVSEGATLTVTAANGVLHNDVPGADGFALAGGVVGVVAGSNTASPVSGNVGGTVTGTYGTLTLNADGSYTYHASSNIAVPAGATDSFVYSIQDGDGDKSTTTLTINVTDAGLSAIPETGLVDEGALSTGSHPGAGVTTTGTLTDNAAGGGTLTYSLANGSSSQVGTHGTLTINANGSWSYTLASAIDSTPHAANGTNNEPADSFTYKVMDQFGNFTTSTLTITATDDVPHAVNDADSVTEGLGNAALGNVLTGVGTTSGIADTFGADGNGGIVSVRGGTEAAGGIMTAVSGATTIHGAYGDLVINPDGSYTYTLTTASIPANVTAETFTYMMKDGDGDTDLAQLTITLNQDTRVPAVTNSTATVYEDGLADGVQHGATSETATGTFTVDAHGEGYSLTLNSTTNVVNGSIITTADGVLTITGVSAPVNGVVTYSYSYTLSHALTHTGQGEINPILDTISISVTDNTGDTSPPAAITVSIVDDIPVLGTIQNATANDIPASAPSVGTLHFTPGADGAGAVTISADVSGVTSGGHALLTQQVGGVLTAYADVDNSGTINAGDTSVFTITVNPTAGTSGQYVFDLTAPLDGAQSTVTLGSNTAFGVGPTNGLVISQPGLPNLVLITGAHSNASFDYNNFLAGGIVPSSQLTAGGVNGSTNGFGVNSNNFDATSLLRFDFGVADDYDGAGPYTAPALTLQTANQATFDLVHYSASDHIVFVAHYTNGTSSTVSFLGSAGTAVITAPAGLQFAWIDAYTPDAGSGKLDLQSIGIISTTHDSTIPVTLTLADGDGDTVTGTFNIHVADNLSPSTAAPPVVLDLNGDGLHFLAQDAGVTFDYNGDGVKEATAWAGPQDGILVHDGNHNGTVDSGAEFMFASAGQTDLQGLAVYDTNHDGLLSAADADFASFAVWQDANSNGVVDAGEMQSLTAAGITAISLTSDGVAGEAANGDVTIAGTGSFTKADGSTGVLADVSFWTGGPGTTDLAKLATAANSNVTLVAALAAAGLASEAAAAHSVAAPGDAIVTAGAEHVEQAVAAVAAAPSGDGHQSISGETRVSIEPTTAPAAAHTELQAANDTHPLTDGADHSAQAATALLSATDAPAPAAHAASFAPAMVAMPSAEALAAAGLTGANVQHAGEVAKELVAALQAGGSDGQAHFDALINALPGHAGGAGAPSAAAASQTSAGVPAWHSDDVAAFQVASFHTNMMEAAMLHHDAVQPVAHAG